MFPQHERLWPPAFARGSASAGSSRPPRLARREFMAGGPKPSFCRCSLQPARRKMYCSTTPGIWERMKENGKWRRRHEGGGKARSQTPEPTNKLSVVSCWLLVEERSGLRGHFNSDFCNLHFAICNLPPIPRVAAGPHVRRPSERQGAPRACPAAPRARQFFCNSNSWRTFADFPLPGRPRFHATNLSRRVAFFRPIPAGTRFQF